MRAITEAVVEAGMEGWVVVTRARVMVVGKLSGKVVRVVKTAVNVVRRGECKQCLGGWCVDGSVLCGSCLQEVGKDTKKYQAKQRSNEAEDELGEDSTSEEQEADMEEEALSQASIGEQGVEAAAAALRPARRRRSFTSVGARARAARSRCSPCSP